MPRMKTTKISFDKFGKDAVAATDTDGKGIKPNTRRIHTGPLVPVENGLSLTAGFVACKSRKCNLPVVHDGECQACHERTVARQNDKLDRERNKAQARRLKEFTPDEKDAWYKRRVNRIKDYARTQSDEDYARLKGSEVLAAAAFSIELMNVSADERIGAIIGFDLKKAQKLGLEDD